MQKVKSTCDIPNCGKIASYGSIFCIDHNYAEKTMKFKEKSKDNLDKIILSDTGELFQPKFVSARKGGRCFNGAHRDSGVIRHAVEPSKSEGYWGNKASCGTSPGLRSYGWTTDEREINCEKCLKKILSPQEWANRQAKIVGDLLETNINHINFVNINRHEAEKEREENS